MWNDRGLFYNSVYLLSVAICSTYKNDDSSSIFGVKGKGPPLTGATAMIREKK